MNNIWLQASLHEPLFTYFACDPIVHTSVNVKKITFISSILQQQILSHMRTHIG